MRAARLVLLLLALAVLAQFLVLKPYRIPSASMLPTLEPGDRVLALRWLGGIGDPERGDVVVFHPNGRGSSVFRSATAASPTFVKRVIGLPGETIVSRDGRVYVCRPRAFPPPHGDPAATPGCARLADPYARGRTGQCGAPEVDLGAETVPAGSYFMLGDNRIDSEDSRCFGAVPRGRILGRVVARYWPPSRIGLP